MVVLETIKRIAEKATGWRRPDKPQGLVRERKPQTFWFKDDGLIPNHPRWPLIIYKGAVRLTPGLDRAAVFEELFDSHGWGRSWRDGIYDYAHYHSRIHEVLGIARGSGRVRFGGANGRILNLKAGDVAIHPAGTGHQRIKASADFLVVGVYRPQVLTTNANWRRIGRRPFLRLTASRDRDRKDGPLMQIWSPRKRRPS
jgi:uncharacterized protein YjlB